MSVGLPGPKAATSRLAISSSEAIVRKAVRQFVNGMYPGTPYVERRRESRYPFPHLIPLTPAAADGRAMLGQEPIVVVGKHISDRGLAFFHQTPLPYRQVIAAIEGRDGRWLRFLLDLTWCRFTRLGWYEGGGRILQLVEETNDCA